MPLRVNLGEQGHGPLLAKGAARVRLEISGIVLDFIELLNQRDHQPRVRVAEKRLDKPSARMRPATKLEDTPVGIEAIVAAVGVGLERAAKVTQELGRAIALVRPSRCRTTSIECNGEARIPGHSTDLTATSNL